MAAGEPSLARRRRKKPPSAEWLRYKVVAAMRKALASRQRTLRVLEERILPPLMRLSGQSPSQDAKCFEEGKRVICGPTSQKKVSTAWALKPGIAVRSTPRIRCISEGTSKVG